MKLLINTASTFKGGGLQVANSFIEDCKQHAEHEYHIVLGFVLAKAIKQEEYPNNFHFYTIPYRPATRVFSFKSHDKFFRDLEKKIRPDVVFTTTGPAYWRPRAPHVIGYNLPHHVYPESPYLQHISLYRRARWKIKKLLAWYFFKHDADCYVVQTDDVNQRLRKFLGRENVITVSNTYNPFFNHPETFPNRLPEKQPGEFRLLSISAWYPHKNLDIIPKIIDCLSEAEKAPIRFVLTLPDEIFRQEIPQQYHALIYNVGSVKLKEAPSLYKECDAMFLPTLLECFSASYAEAMIMEKPIITSDMGFAHTVCDRAAVYFDPINPAEIAQKIVQLVHDYELQQKLIQLGKERISYFGTSAQRTEEYLNICRNTLHEVKN
ncbi:MAG: hypothetical protein RLY16_2449 [Bacteroidota bacterium]|jgi:glycosyltransferase involved in cell wall biosynthesis